MTLSKRFFTFLFTLMAVFALSVSFIACSDGGNNGSGKGDTEQEETTKYTVTLYTAVGASATTVEIEEGKSLSAALNPTKDGYEFKGWFTADGTDYTGKAITGAVTLFAYFVKESETTSEDGKTKTTTTNEVGADLYESEKTVAVTTNDDGSTTTVTEEMVSKTNADGSKTTTESESTKIEKDDEIISETSKTTVTETDSTGNTTSTVETTVAEDGTTTTKTTDADGNTSTNVTGKNDTPSTPATEPEPTPAENTKPAIDINEILLEKLGAASTATTFKPSAVAPASTAETHVINEDVNALMWLDGTTIFYYCADSTSGKKIPLGESAASMFAGCTSLVTIDMTGFDTSDCTDMSNMFNGCTALTSVDVSEFDTSKVTSMYMMFRSCSALGLLDVTSFDTSNVVNMCEMFNHCSALTSLNVRYFKTSNVTTMNRMFNDCGALTSLDVSNFDTSNVTAMSRMFGECAAITKLDLSNFDTSKVTTMEYMFRYCTALEELDVSSFNTSNVTNMAGMFFHCESLVSLDLSNFDTSNVTMMGYSGISSTSGEPYTNGMFSHCKSLISLDISSFDTSNVTDMGSMFYDCYVLSSLDVSHFNTSKVTNMNRMFHHCYALTSLDVTHFDTSNVTNMYCMFLDDRISELDVSNFATSKVTNMGGMFGGCYNLTELDISNFDMGNVTKTTMSWTSSSDGNIHYKGLFGSCSKLKTIYVAAGTDLSILALLPNSELLFDGCYSLVGGNGTTYDSSHTDKTYARVDGGTSAPGYFTAKGSTPSSETPSGYVGSYKGSLTASWKETVYMTLTIKSDGTWAYTGYTDATYSETSDSESGLSYTVENGGITLTVDGETDGDGQPLTVACTTTDGWSTMTLSGIYSGTLTKQ